MLSRDLESLQAHVRRFLKKAFTLVACPECEGTRLNKTARSSKIGQYSISDVCQLSLNDALAWVNSVKDEQVAPLVRKISETLPSFVDIGLGDLSLDRASSSLSGGEAQRTKLVRHLSSSLTDVTYVFDESTIGLHPHDIHRLNQLLVDLRNKGNTVLVVEHKPEVISIADHVVELGPRAGTAGGEICFIGTVDELLAAGTLTGQYFSTQVQLKTEVRSPASFFPVREANLNNLKNICVDVPLGIQTVFTGVAGSGKSSLIQCLRQSLTSQEKEFIDVDQSQLKGTSRSNIATYTGLLDLVRKAFAKANDVKPSFFSANSEGACPECSGSGVTVLELGFMEKITSPCVVCEGKRFDSAVLEFTFGGKNILEFLDFTVDDAFDFLSANDTSIKAGVAILGRLIEVGLGYIRLNQPLSTLSGGERQRLKLASAMAKEAEIIILDEPTVGLHLADIEPLLRLLDRLVDQG